MRDFEGRRRQKRLCRALRANQRQAVATKLQHRHRAVALRLPEHAQQIVAHLRLAVRLRSQNPGRDHACPKQQGGGGASGEVHWKVFRL
jgi:hypothetical protein